MCASSYRACDLQSKIAAMDFLQFQFTAVPYARYSYFDTRIVRRSNMLLADMGGKPYGKSLNFLQFSVLPTDAWRAGKKHINKIQQGSLSLQHVTLPSQPEEMLLQQKGGGGGAGGGIGGGSGGGGGGGSVEAERKALEAKGASRWAVMWDLGTDPRISCTFSFFYWCIFLYHTNCVLL